MKRKVLVTLDSETHDMAKEKNINVSSECEEALRIKLMPSKHDIDEHNLRIRCNWCGDVVNEGFLCMITKRFACIKCETKGYRCVPQIHEHIRLPPLNGESIKDRIKMAQDGLIKQKPLSEVKDD